MTTNHTDNGDGVLTAVDQLRGWSTQHLSGRIITVASGKGGVGKTTLAIELAYCLDATLVDLDWDNGNASRALGWRHETRVRSPLLDALDSGRTPRSISGGDNKPRLIPSGPDLETNEPTADQLADALTAWSGELSGPIVVDTHPGKGPAAYGAMSAAHVVATPTELGERELDALDGWCADLDGYPVLVVPNMIPRVPAAAQLDRLEKIAVDYGLTASTPVPAAVWMPRRKARTALCAARRTSARTGPQIATLATVAREVATHALH